MATYAVLDGNLVVNVIVADHAFIDQVYPGAVAYGPSDPVSIGSTYNPTSQTFLAPVESPE